MSKIAIGNLSLSELIYGYCPLIYGNYSWIFLINLTANFLSLLISTYLIILEIYIFGKSLSKMKIVILFNLAIHSSIEVLVSIVPFPYSRPNFGFFCQDFVDFFYGTSWIFITVWLSKATVYPFIQSSLKKKIWTISLVFLLIVSNLTYWITEIVGDFAQRYIGDELIVIYEFFDITSAIPFILMIIFLIRLYRKVNGTGTIYTILKKRLRSFLLMLFVIAGIMGIRCVFDVTYMILTRKYKAHNIRLCRDNDSNCYDITIPMSFFLFFENTLATLTFLLTLLSFTPKVAASTDSDSQSDSQLESEDKTMHEDSQDIVSLRSLEEKEEEGMRFYDDERFGYSAMSPSPPSGFAEEAKSDDDGNADVDRYQPLLSSNNSDYSKYYYKYS